MLLVISGYDTEDADSSSELLLLSSNDVDDNKVEPKSWLQRLFGGDKTAIVNKSLRSELVVSSGDDDDDDAIAMPEKLMASGCSDDDGGDA